MIKIANHTHYGEILHNSAVFGLGFVLALSLGLSAVSFSSISQYGINSLQRIQEKTLDRKPIGERPISVLDESVAIPPSIVRQGFVYRINLSGKFNDNIFFTPLNKKNDFITSVSPGIHYIKRKANYSLEADYQINAKLYANNSSLNDATEAQTFLLKGHYNLSPKTKIYLREYYRSFKDPAGTIIASTRLPKLDNLLENSFFLSVTHNLNPRVLLKLGGSRLSNNFAGMAINSDVNQVKPGVSYILRPGLQIGINARKTNYKFNSNPNIKSDAYMVNFVHDITRKYTLQGTLGRYQSYGSDGKTGDIRKATLTLKLKNHKVIFNFSEDLMLRGIGSNALFKTKTLSASSRSRLSKTFYGDLSAENTIYSSLSGAANEFKINSFKAGLTYSLQRGRFLRAELSRIYEKDKSGILETTSNKLSLSFNNSF